MIFQKLLMVYKKKINLKRKLDCIYLNIYIRLNVWHLKSKPEETLNVT